MKEKEQKMSVMISRKIIWQVKKNINMYVHTSYRIQVAIIRSQIRIRMKMMKVLIWMRTLMVVLKMYLRKVKKMRGKNGYYESMIFHYYILNFT